jgi:hypothetical protein
LNCLTCPLLFHQTAQVSIMILPSDADPPPDRNEGKDDADTPWWESPDLSSPDDDDEDDENSNDGDSDVSYLGDPDDPGSLPPELASMAGPGWRKELYKDLLDSLIQLQAIEDPDDDFTPPEPPDLYTFYGELAALRNELRKQGRKSEESLGELSKVLLPTSSGKLAKSSSAQLGPVSISPVAWPLEACLSLLSVWDLLPHATSSAAFEAAFQPLLKAAGLTRIPTLDQPFDPATMTLAGCEKTSGKAARVLREVTAGFLREGTLLRPAGVIVSS